MKVTLKLKEILFDMQNKSQNETSGIESPEARYRATAGSENTDELRRDIMTAYSYVTTTVLPFLKDKYVDKATDDDYLNAEIVFDFNISERRMNNKLPAFSDSLHSFMTNMALSLFYKTAAMADLEKSRAEQAALDLKNAEMLICTKTRPVKPHSGKRGGDFNNDFNDDFDIIK